MLLSWKECTVDVMYKEAIPVPVSLTSTTTLKRWLSHYVLSIKFCVCVLDQRSATYGPLQARGFILSGPPTMYERLDSLMYFLYRHSKLDNGVTFTPVFCIFYTLQAFASVAKFWTLQCLTFYQSCSFGDFLFLRYRLSIKSFNCIGIVSI
jgi:hypothetical protein